MNAKSGKIDLTSTSSAFNNYQKANEVEAKDSWKQTKKHLRYALAQTPEQIQKFLDNVLKWILSNRKKIDSLLEFSKFETEARNEIKSKVRHLEEMATKLEETDVRCKVKVQSLVERIDDLQEDSQFFEHIIANIKDSVANLTCASCWQPATWKIDTPVKSNIHSLENKKKVKAHKVSELEDEKTQLEKKIKELYKKIRSLKKAVKFDSLTKAYSPCYYHNKLPNIVNKCLEKNNTFRFVLIDMNSFKYINDTHGHHIWDKALITLVQAFHKQKSFQPNKKDAIIRRSWDEFVYITLRGENETLTILQNIQKALDNVHLRNEKNEDIRISFSSGIVSSDEEQLTQDIENSPVEAIDIIAKLADERMYQNKKSKK